MNKIKFRVWNKKKKKMQRVGSIDLCGGFIRLYPSQRVWRSMVDFELMQYTGLTDKNGEVRYNSHLAMFSLYDTRGEFIDSFPVISALKDDYPFMVIGNIWENSELLK